MLAELWGVTPAVVREQPYLDQQRAIVRHNARIFAQEVHTGVRDAQGRKHLGKEEIPPDVMMEARAQMAQDGAAAEE